MCAVFLSPQNGDYNPQRTGISIMGGGNKEAKREMIASNSVDMLIINLIQYSGLWVIKL